MAVKNENTVCFDYSHNNTLTIESSGNVDFTQFLFGSSFRLGKIQAGFTDLEKLKDYRLVVIGGPRESQFSQQEIRVLVEYVKKGGNLLIFHDEGGDYGANTNLSELTQFFGFRFRSNIMFDSVHFQRQQSRVIISDFEHHPTTENVDAIVLSSACSIEVDELISGDQNIEVIPIAKSSINAYCTLWDGNEWNEEMDAWNSIMAVYSKVYKGRVIGLTTVSMLSSLSSAYGFFALNNQEFIANIFKWLMVPPDSEEGVSRDQKLLTLAINYHLLLWMEDRIKKDQWTNIREMVNFSVKHFKDHYDEIMESGEREKRELILARKNQLEYLHSIKDLVEQEKRARIMDQELRMLDLSNYTNEVVQDIQEILNGLKELTHGNLKGSFSEEELEKRMKMTSILVSEQDSRIINEDNGEINGDPTSKDDSCVSITSISGDSPEKLRERLDGKELAISCEDESPSKKELGDQVKIKLEGDSLEILLGDQNLEKILENLRNPQAIQEKIDSFRTQIK